MIHPSVIAVWHEYSQPLEGRMSCMYLDVKGLVTTGVGNLIDSPGAAIQLPWQTSDGALATVDQIVAEWHRVKRMQPGWGPQYYRDRTSLRLTDDAIDELVLAVMHAMAVEIEKQLPDWRTWPADAQLGALSRAWAAGTSLAKWPRHREACARRDWIEAGRQSALVTVGNPGVVPRNERQMVAFTNASVVDSRTDGSLRLDECYWPLQLVA